MISNVVATALPADERLLVRKNTISNGSGPRLCIVTGTHGDELEGQYVCYRMAQLLNEKIGNLTGSVDIFPALNPLGMDSIMRGVPGFDLDMNRIFPGDPSGTMAESSAYSIIENLKGADMVVDIHSSNIFLREVPQVRINVETEEKLVPYARLLNMDFIWVHEAATVLQSTLAHSLNTTGTPCLVVEMGVGMRINQDFGEQLVSGLLNLMTHLGMWHDESCKNIAVREPVFSKGPQVSFLNAEASGIFISNDNYGIIVEHGDEVGRIVSPLTGEVLSYVKAPCKGYLFTIRAYPIVYEGSLLARIHRM